ncbi:hypothetical protein [Flavobacterium sp.]|uniref:hypothetical protein n=1 Tax=Flavobacterium sp. TaxID=239 RepID=UPI0025E6B077|nr:hypothetical protein [Flavobacterium sp.]
MASEGIELVIEVVIEFVPRYFGAFLKWIYFRFKIPFSEILEQNGTKRIGYVSLGLIILGILLFFKF